MIVICAHYTVFTEEEIIEMRAIIAEIERKMYGGKPMSKAEVRPTNIAPVVTNDGARPMKWGFPNPRGKGVIINARSETASEKPMFREAVAKRRCAIPATGYFESGFVSEQLSLLPDAQTQGKKERYIFTMPSSALFYLAGFYSDYELDGVMFPHFVVMTMDANSSVADVHNRMPVILSGGWHIDWLKNGVLEGVSPMLAKSRG